MEKLRSKLRLNKLYTLLITACTVTSCMSGTVYQKASGSVQTQNEVKMKIEVSFPICENYEWTYEQKLECIRLCNQYNVNINTGEGVAELLNELARFNEPEPEIATEPQLTMGGI